MHHDEDHDELRQHVVGERAQGRSPTDTGRTGDADVDAALARLDGLDGLPVREHARVFDDVQVALQDRLADVED